VTDADALWDRLERRHLLVDARVAAALRDVPVTGFVSPEVRPAAPLDAPLPTSLAPPTVVLPAPRYLAMLLQMLELEKGVSVLLLGSSGGYIEAVISRLVVPATVTVWEEDASLAAAAKEALALQGFGERVAFVHAPPPLTRFDRVTTTDAIQRLAPAAKEAVADMGFAVFRRLHEAFGFVKILRSGDEYMELSTIELTSPMRVEVGAARRVSDVDVARELLLARMLENVWSGRPESEPERHFLAVVEDTYAKPAELPPMAADDAARYDAAKKLFHLGYVYQSAGDLEASSDAYRASIAVRPTAEAHTFLGWVYSFEDRREEAIEECRKAIAVDPSFGNPYNDIGAYLIDLERLDEAIPWFEKAKASTRYCCHFYAYANLGRVYMMRGMLEKAKRELQEALRLNPEYAYARELLRRVERGRDYVA
jgi:Tfp pilus assembly protein PilF/protein-L-isoaspartate O-methyltransferase